MAQQDYVGRGFGKQVNQRTQTAAHEDDPEPIVIRTAANEVDNGKELNNQAPRIE